MSATRLPTLYLVTDAASLARCSPWTIRKEIREGRLRARRIGRLVRITDRDLAAWMGGDTGQPTQEGGRWRRPPTTGAEPPAPSSIP
jgi:excisionase family DNA binding protein